MYKELKEMSDERRKEFYNYFEKKTCKMFKNSDYDYFNDPCVDFGVYRHRYFGPERHFKYYEKNKW